ncbi:hypothetical protein RRG08_040229 [Elysia crispata]|uniref:Uncharacterized protein n=1 Tax=Elysia crispata TaxID=231223 RepID=A0AAE0YIT9_9GAST|nr:hypothetical protein RRG08_040229 [Elysia crispata]
MSLDVKRLQHSSGASSLISLFGYSNEIFSHTRSNVSLYNVARLRAKTKVRHTLVRKALFAGVAACSTHTEDALERQIDRFSNRRLRWLGSAQARTTRIPRDLVYGQVAAGSGHVTVRDMREVRTVPYYTGRPVPSV